MFKTAVLSLLLGLANPPAWDLDVSGKDETWHRESPAAPIVLEAVLVGHEFDDLAPGESALVARSDVYTRALRYRIVRVVRDASRSLSAGDLLTVRQEAFYVSDLAPMRVTYDRASGALDFHAQHVGPYASIGGLSRCRFQYPVGARVALLLDTDRTHFRSARSYFKLR